MTPTAPADAAVETAVAAVRSGDQARWRGAGRPPGPGGRARCRGTVAGRCCTSPPTGRGTVPNVAATIAALVGAGADVGARFVGEHTETPLHWAASNDDVEAVAALLDAGADIDAPGAVIGGGTPLNDATAFAQWDAARLLVERGATVSPLDAAALGMTDRVADAAAAPAPSSRWTPLLWARLPRRPPRHGIRCWSTPVPTSTGGAGTT